MTCHSTITNRISRFTESISKCRRGFPSETQVKHGEQVVHGDKLPEEKIGHNVLCSCGSDNRRKRTLTIEVLPVRKLSGRPKELRMTHQTSQKSRFYRGGQLRKDSRFDAYARRCNTEVGGLAIRSCVFQTSLPDIPECLHRIQWFAANPILDRAHVEPIVDHFHFQRFVGE